MEANGIEIPVVLLTGSMGVKKRRAAYAILESDQPALVVGTHALIQEKVQYRNLALVITDEQHLFWRKAAGNLFVERFASCISWL